MDHVIKHNLMECGLCVQVWQIGPYNSVNFLWRERVLVATQED
jgi:hypothetical protein